MRSWWRATWASTSGTLSSMPVEPLGPARSAGASWRARTDMRQLFRRTSMWRKREMAPRYDVVIIGGGAHGLSTAYYLAKLGVPRIAVIQIGDLGSGGSRRNPAAVRAQYRRAEGVPFYAKSVQMYERLGEELDYNLLFSQQGHLTLAHTDSAVTGLRIRAEVNQLLGVDSRLIWPDEIARLVPGLDVSSHPRYPI